MPHDIDDSAVETDGERLHLVERPLVRLVVCPS
jgi:hypothetical protein